MLLGHEVEVQPLAAVGSGHDALGAEDRAVVAAVQLVEHVLKSFLAELLRRLLAPGGEDVVGVVMMVMVALALGIVALLAVVVMVVMLVLVVLVMFIVIVMMLWSHVPVSYNVIYVIPIFVDLILITFGVSAILAHFGVFFDDLKNITNVGLRILFYMSGIFYVITDRVNEAIATLLLKVNPVGFLIDACRSSLVYCETPHRRLILLWFVIGAVLSAIGVAIIYKNENNYVKVI